MSVLLRLSILTKLINRVFICSLGDMMDVEFIGQLIDSMEQAVARLEWAVGAKNKAEEDKMRIFIFDLYGKTKEALR